ncbi:hypothetical protein KL86PLE_90317 [uncultured Pleomorphomonas sp.]|uniref:Uncharacterized protein n=1 Tax=uncultured Pleomorphomonas sp. TaxID=442121 RepID=A0A212LP18_9HYPH|nr:hypothetical protein KL86PLE_90317 [uncultured Pleomorphomonas sp.]
MSLNELIPLNSLLQLQIGDISNLSRFSSIFL